jgi:hypothetical protein
LAVSKLQLLPRISLGPVVCEISLCLIQKALPIDALTLAGSSFQYINPWAGEYGKLTVADVDERIKTPLLRYLLDFNEGMQNLWSKIVVSLMILSHQRTAVDFICQKEGRKPSSDFSLWTSCPKGSRLL